MVNGLEGYDFSAAVEYHYGQFPPAKLDYERLALNLTAAMSALARYDAKLEKLHNKELLLAPLRNAEAVVTSRIEGTIATLDEILKIQADVEDDNTDDPANYRQEAIEVYSYTRAVKHAQALLNDGLPISGRLIREAHSRLLFFGRGADKTPGDFKKDQNFVVDKRNKRILFVPATPEYLADKGMLELENYINTETIEPLIQTAIMHVEFEGLHPFKDGNGRLGRMLVPLNLWQKNLIHAPHLYISSAVEERRDEYVDRLREVSEKGAWTDWVVFFLEILKRQAEINMTITDTIGALYDSMATEFRERLRSQWAPVALDYVFTRPVFRNSAFTASSGIPTQTAHRISRTLIDSGLLTQVEPASGRRAALLAFQPLLEIVRT
jgi:cell filamentation protein, protein adenylyltransferase